MRIFILEDYYYTAEDLQEDLQYELGPDAEFITANSIREAKEKLARGSFRDVDYIIADLNMSTNGLSDKQKAETQGAFLTGWVWIKDNILNNSDFDHIRIIFYSAFINRLGGSESFQRLRSGRIILVNKNDDNCLEHLVRMING